MQPTFILPQVAKKIRGLLVSKNQENQVRAGFLINQKLNGAVNQSMKILQLFL